MSVKKLNRDAVEVLEAFIRRKERKLRTYLEVLNMLRREDGVPPRELGELSADLIIEELRLCRFSFSR